MVFLFCCTRLLVSNSRHRLGRFSERALTVLLSSAIGYCTYLISRKVQVFPPNFVILSPMAKEFTSTSNLVQPDHKKPGSVKRIDG